MAATPNLRVALADWGYLIALEQVADAPVADGTRNARGAVNALHVVLTADHGGLPAGTEILVAHAEAAVSTPVDTTTATQPATTTRRSPIGRPAHRHGRSRCRSRRRPGCTRTSPAPSSGFRRRTSRRRSRRRATSSPSTAASSFADTFGAARAGVVWHHGQDIFAPLGTPLLAVADGTIFSVGWNDLGGYRLWLRDRQGNQFYYAHLSAFSPLAVDGNEVKAGAVVGFVGNTGDAQTTPYHLHFEIHPVGLLPLGYDGVVNPMPYLLAWRRLEDITFAAGRGWAPPVPSNATAPRPAAILLGSTDISSASGLDPGSLDRALTAPVSQGDSAVLGAG